MVNYIEFPIFDGVSVDLRHWISWLEDFFVREKFTALEKMNLAQSLLEGEANAWFYSSRKRFAFQSWEHLVVDLLLWRFGYFGDFGVFSDPELFLLWNKYDRILQKQRVEKRRKRMKTTAITPQESISSPATIPETIPVDKFSNQQVEEISAEKKESKQEVDLSMEKIASQLKLPNTKVHVSDSENLRNIETRIENSVLDNFESVVKEAKIQTNIRMDVVNGDDERIQRVMSSSKNVSAHQVLDKMCQLKRLKPKNKKKLRLSPKSRMFKFKNKMLQRNRSQMDPHHVMDSNIVTSISSSSRAKFGFKWKEHNSRYWRRMRHTRLHMRHKWKSKHLRAVVGLQHNPSYALDVVTKPVIECKTTAAISQTVLEQSVSHDCFLGSLWEKQSVSWLGVVCVLAECMMHKATVISAKLYSLFSFEVDTVTNMSSGLSQTSQVWEPGIGVCSRINQPIDSRRASRVWERGGLDISAGLTDWLMKCYKGFELSRLMRKLHKIDLQWARRKDWAELCVGHGLLVRWCGWMVFDRGKNKLILRDVTSEVIETLAKHCPQLTDLGFLDCLNHEMRGSNTSSHNLVHLMWHFKSQQLILLSLRILLHRFIVALQRTLIVQYRTCIDPNHQGLIVLVVVRLIMLSTRCNSLFLPFWKKNCWCQRLFLLTGLMMWGAGSSWFRGSLGIYPRPLGCFHRTLYVFILHSSLRTSSFSGREVLIRFKAVMTWQSVEEQSEDLD